MVESIAGLTLVADFYHIDLRAVTVSLDPQFLIAHEDEFPTQVIRGPSTGPNDPFGPIVLLLLPEQNLGRLIQEGWDYEAIYVFETARLGHGDLGTFTTTINGTYLDRVVLQAVPGGPEQNVVGKFGGGFLGPNGGGSFTHNRVHTSLFYDGTSGSCLGGLDMGVNLSYIGQYWDVRGFETSFNKNGNRQNRKVRDWTTLDIIVNYTFSLPGRGASDAVAGSNKNGAVKAADSKEKAMMPVSTAEYHPCGWRAWLNNTTVTVGMNNVTDEQPPFVAGAFENGYDESTANLKGRTWYVALKKRF